MNLKLCILTTKRSSLITPVFVEIGYFHFHASGRLSATNVLKFTMFMFMFLFLLLLCLLLIIILSLWNYTTNSLPTCKK